MNKQYLFFDRDDLDLISVGDIRPLVKIVQELKKKIDKLEERLNRFKAD